MAYSAKMCWSCNKKCNWQPCKITGPFQIIFLATPTKTSGIFYSIKKGNKAFRKGINLYFCHPFKKGNREVAQAGSAPGLGPGGRRFESCLPDLVRVRVASIQSGSSRLLKIASILIGALLTKIINSVIFSW